MRDLILFLLFHGMTGCVSLTSVNKFAEASVDGLSHFDQLHYGFKAHCLDACRFEAVRKFEINRDLNCSCGPYVDADAAMKSMYTAIKTYFSGLSVLTAKNLTEYSLGALNDPLQEGQYSSIHIEKKEVDAYLKISEVLLRASTENFRKAKTKQYIEQANEPIAVLLDKFGYVLRTNLYDELNFRKEKWYAYYTELKLNRSITEYDKGRATMDYYQQLSEAEQIQNQINTLVKSFDKIKWGHQKLYEYRDKLSAKELGLALGGLARDLEDLMTAFRMISK